MGFKSDIEIAQECEMLPIKKIAEILQVKMSDLVSNEQPL